MKKTSLIFIFVIFLFSLSSLKAQVIGIQWNTFLGSSSPDYGRDIALDSSGNIYVTGASDATWGLPINAHNSGCDAFVAGIDSSGNLLWNTFLGSAIDDYGRGITLDSSGNIYVSGGSNATWGSPVNAHSGNRDYFVAFLDSSGNLLWNTFLGSVSKDDGYGIALDSSGNIYVTGVSDATWGSPVNAYSGNRDSFVACLDSSGNLLWNTFLGSTVDDLGYGITLDSSGNVYVTGYSNYTWGSPVNAHSGGYDAYVACLNSSGNLLWNTFLGSSSNDYSFGIARDSSGNIYVIGHSDTTWGSPVNVHSSNADAFVVCMDSSGNLLWNTFLGSSSNDYGIGIVRDSSGNIYVTGECNATWGSPVNAYSGDYDGFVVKITPQPIPDIKANGSDGPIIIIWQTLQINVSLISYGITANADWWVLANTPLGWYYYDYSSKKWKPGKNVTRQGSLMDLNPKTVLNTSGLKTGTYTFYFGVDMNMDGNLTKSSLYYDEVNVTVTSD